MYLNIQLIALFPVQEEKEESLDSFTGVIIPSDSVLFFY